MRYKYRMKTLPEVNRFVTKLLNVKSGWIAVFLSKRNNCPGKREGIE